MQRSVSLGTGDHQTVDFDHVTTGTITGTVSVDGAGLAGLTVQLSTGVSTATGGGGVYSFSLVPAGTHTVTVPAFPAGSNSKTVTLAAGEIAVVDFSNSPFFPARD